MKALYSLPLNEQETHIQFIREQLSIKHNAAMKKQNLQVEVYPILENESIKIGTFKASRSINT